MAETDNIHRVDDLLGKSIISRTTGNKLGSVHDLLVDPVEGVLLGLSVDRPEGGPAIIDRREVYSFGPHAVMVNADDSVGPFGGSPVAEAPLAKKELIGANVLTEGGKLIGQVADIFVHDTIPPQVIYDVRESLLAKLLGRSMFIPASASRAVSSDFKRIIVPDETPEVAAESLEAFATSHGVARIGEGGVTQGRGVAALPPFEEGSVEVTESAEEAVVSKRARVVEEVVVSKEVGERTETIRDTVRRTDVDVEEVAPERAKSSEPAR